MDIEARHLRALVAIADHGTHTAAAAALHLSQPTLTRTVRQLEYMYSARLVKVGTARRFSSTTRDSLLVALRSVLAPQYVTRAREVAALLTKPEASVSIAADLLEAKAGVVAVQ